MTLTIALEVPVNLMQLYMLQQSVMFPQEEAELLYHPDKIIPDELLKDPEDELRVKFKNMELVTDSRKKWSDAWELKM